MFKITDDQKEAVWKALEPDLNLKGRLLVPWVDYTEEEREAMLQTATPILYDDRKAAKMIVDEMTQRVKKYCLPTTRAGVMEWAARELGIDQVKVSNDS